jgi:hypothetical protein
LHRPLALRCDGFALELRGSELSLKVDQRALDLDMEDLGWASQNHVGCSQIARRDRYLKLSLPARIRRRSDELGENQLP